MNIENKLQLLQQQKLVLTPELKQAIAVLQLPVLELENFLEEQLQENPVLELDLGEGEQVSIDHQEKEQSTEEWLEYFADRSDLGVNFQEKSDLINERNSAPLPGLKDFLQEQAVVVFNKSERQIADFIIENIDENGYLHLTEEEVSKALGITNEVFLNVLTRIQNFEPAGIAARSLAECLSNQVRQRGFLPQQEKLLLSLINEHLQEVADSKVTRLAGLFNITAAEMQEYFDIIKKLNPRPGASYSSNQATYIVPDVVVHNISGEFVIIVNDGTLPRITMSETYLTLLHTAQDEGVKKYIQQKINSATWLLKSIEQRRLTLYRVSNAILKLQIDFFREGKQYLKPMVLRQIAEVVDLHESTVSRAVSNKYMQTPHGVFPLKFFFNGGVTTAYGGETASTSIKDEIKKLITGEEAKDPLSDQKIADILTARGINISRRTVAKYREEMNIPSSAKRKRY